MPGPGPGGRLHIIFGVVTLAQQEQLHQFSGEVLVGAALPIVLIVEVQQHGGLHRHRLVELDQITHSLGPEQLDLIEHQVVLVDLVQAAAQHSMPEQGNLFLNRLGNGAGPFEPEVGHADVSLAPVGGILVEVRDVG